MESKGVPRNQAQRKPQRPKSRDEEELQAQRTAHFDPCRNAHKPNRLMKKHDKEAKTVNQETMTQPSRPSSFQIPHRPLSFVGSKPRDDTDVTEKRKRDSANRISPKDDDRFSDEGSIGNRSSDQDTDLASRMLID